MIRGSFWGGEGGGVLDPSGSVIRGLPTALGIELPIFDSVCSKFVGLRRQMQMQWFEDMMTDLSRRPSVVHLNFVTTAVIPRIGCSTVLHPSESNLLCVQLRSRSSETVCIRRHPTFGALQLLIYRMAFLKMNFRWRCEEFERRSDLE